MRLHHLAIQVPDLDVAAAFYVGVLGLVALRRQDHALWVDGGGTIIMLERCDGKDTDRRGGPWSQSEPGLFVVAFAIEPSQRNAWRAKLMAAGVAVDHESNFSVYFRDPWGARLAVSHYPEPAL
jgi:glyoxylase I family protein